MQRLDAQSVWVFAGEYENTKKKFPFFVLQVLGNTKWTEMIFRKLQEAGQNQSFCIFIG